MVYNMRLSPAKDSHFPLWHTSHYVRPQADIYRSLLFVVISLTEMVSYFLPSGGLHLILSQITLSVCAARSRSSIFTLLLDFPLVCLSLLNFINLSLTFLHISFIRLQWFHHVNVRGLSAAVCCSIQLHFTCNPGDWQTDKDALTAAWQREWRTLQQHLLCVLVPAHKLFYWLTT